MPSLADFSSWLMSFFDPDRIAAAGLSLDDIRPDENLFEAGVVDSFTMVELLGIIEDRFGIDIDVMDVDPEIFFTVQGLYTHVQHSLPS